MPKFRVHFETGASMSITVEADDEESAIDTAYNEIPGDICAQCSGWRQPWGRELGEWELADKDPQYPHVEPVED